VDSQRQSVALKRWLGRLASRANNDVAKGLEQGGRRAEKLLRPDELNAQNDG